MTWTTELKEKVKQRYLAAKPTVSTNAEIIKEIAEDIEQSPNGVRQVLVREGVYIKQEVGETKATESAAPAAGKRVSKESQIDSLRQAIKARGLEVDEEILEKLTGKAASYFAKLLA